MDGIRYPVVELRQYTLRPGQREVLIDLDNDQRRAQPCGQRFGQR